MPRQDSVPGRRIANPHAWMRFRRIMRWMLLLALACVAVTLVYLRSIGAGVSLPMAAAAAAGVFLTVMVATGLMSLVFLSAGTGHDEDADDPFDERH
jgi:hypothetical protein